MNLEPKVREIGIEENRLGHNSSECHHRKTSVLNFLVPEELDLVLCLAFKVPGTEAEVTGVSSGSLKHLSNTEVRNNFKQSDENEGISHNSILNHNIVGSGGTESGSVWVNNESKINSNGEIETDGSGEAKVGAWDEVVMEAKEDTSRRVSGIPQDEKGLVGLRVRDPGSGTSRED